MQLKWPMLWDLFSLFPAHAGVIPRMNRNNEAHFTFPRTRGGDPKTTRRMPLYSVFSPHTRG